MVEDAETNSHFCMLLYYSTDMVFHATFSYVHD